MVARRTLSVTQPLSADEEALLRALARVLMHLPRALDADLLRDQRLPQSEYFVLMHLSEAPGKSLRMSELAAAAALSLSGMTRLVSKLECEGLVARERIAGDGRGCNAVLTGAGLRRLRKAWPTHLASVRRRIFDNVPISDLPIITAALTRLAGGDPIPASGGCSTAPEE